MSWFCSAVSKLWPAAVTIPVAVILTQWVAQELVEERKPKLKLAPEGVYPPPGLDATWLGTSGPKTFHSWRIIVKHTEIPSNEIPNFLRWFIKRRVQSREPAYNCKAQLTFYHSNGVEKFKMQGRWATSPEPSRVLNAQEKIYYPDTVDVGFHDDEPTILDCIHKFDDSKVTYGWNNVSYAFNGTVPDFKLEVGTYTVDVKISSPNIKPFTTKFDIQISEDWQKTSLKPAGAKK